jgi:hypothetical protein
MSCLCGITGVIDPQLSFLSSFGRPVLSSIRSRSRARRGTRPSRDESPLTIRPYTRLGAPSSAAVSTTTSFRTRDINLALPLQVSTGIRGIYTLGCPGCARTAARTSSPYESCSDRAGYAFGMADHACISKGPAASRGRAAPDKLAVPKESGSPNHSNRRMLPLLPQPPGPSSRTGRPASAPCRQVAITAELGGGW